jgi:uncharacterized membrane protein
MKGRITARRLLNYFLGGLIITLPIAATGFIIYRSFVFLDGLFPTEGLLGKSIPGLSILIILGGITLVGYVGQWFLTKPLLDFMDSQLEKIPGIKIIYSSIKDLMGAFVGDKKKFTEAVAVEMSNGIYKLGFVTSKNLSELNMDGFVAVYFPHSYNFSGNLFLVPQERIRHIDGNSSELMKFIVSGGVTDIHKETR